MKDFIVLVITIFTLVVLFALTLLNILRQHKNKADAAWNELDKQLIIRRDTVPCLLESARIQAGSEADGPFKRWEMLKNMRSELLKNNLPRDKRLDLEIKLGNAIEALCAIAKEHPEIGKDTIFLESEKDLRRDTAVEIKKAYEKWTVCSGEYNDKLHKFPYIVPAKIFRLKYDTDLR